MKRDRKREKKEREFTQRLSKVIDEMIIEEFGERKAFALFFFPDDERYEGSYSSNAPFMDSYRGILETLIRTSNRESLKTVTKNLPKN